MCNFRRPRQSLFADKPKWANGETALDGRATRDVLSINIQVGFTFREIFVRMYNILQRIGRLTRSYKNYFLEKINSMFIFDHIYVCIMCDVSSYDGIDEIGV